jgi:hypothetical protein
LFGPAFYRQGSDPAVDAALASRTVAAPPLSTNADDIAQVQSLINEIESGIQHDTYDTMTKWCGIEELLYSQFSGGDGGLPKRLRVLSPTTRLTSYFDEVRLRAFIVEDVNAPDHPVKRRVYFKADGATLAA